MASASAALRMMSLRLGPLKRGDFDARGACHGELEIVVLEIGVGDNDFRHGGNLSNGKFLDRLYSAFHITPRNASRLGLSGCFSRVCICCVSQKMPRSA